MGVIFSKRKSVTVSMTTVPWRLESALKSVKTILSVSIVDLVILNIPKKYGRDDRSSKWFIDEQLLSKFPKTDRFILNRCEDYGPITKILPTLDIITEGTLIIVDDQMYHTKFIKSIAEAQNKSPNTVHTYYSYTYEDIEVPQGVDIISFNVEDVHSLKEYYSSLRGNSYCKMVDDLVLGSFIQSKKLKLKTLDRGSDKWVWKPLSKKEEGETLSSLGGEYSRENSMRQCYNAIRKINY